MRDTWIRHMIAAMGTLVAFLAWWSGYFSGSREWWWTFFGVLIIYAALYKLIKA